MSRSQCRRRVALGTGVRQVNHSEALGGQQDSMAFIKIRLVRLFTALAVKTRKKRAIFTSEETKTTIMLPLQIFRQISCPVEEATSKDDVEIEDFCRRL